MIYAIVGKPGAGKSYLLTRQCKFFLESGIDVYSNVEIDPSKLDLKPVRAHWYSTDRVRLGRLYYWQSLEDFRYITNGIVLLDEAGAYFEPREWAKFSIEDRVKFQQHRKQRLDIYLTVQSFGRVDAIIRQLTAVVFEVKKYGSLFVVREFSPDDIDLKTRKTLKVKMYLFDKKIADSYDTYATVNLREKSVKHFPLMLDHIKSLKGGDKN